MDTLFSSQHSALRAQNSAFSSQHLALSSQYLSFVRSSWSVVRCLLSAVLLILAHPPYHLWFLAWFALVPLLSAIEGASFRRSFGLGYLFGVFYCFGMFWWFVHVTIPGMILLNLFLALYFALFTGTCALIAKASWPRRVILTACAWTAWEFVRSRFLSGFGWAGLGHTQYQQIPLIQIADIAGVYGISFLVALVNAVVSAALALRKRGRDGSKDIFSLLTGAGLLIAAVLVYGFSVTAAPVSLSGDKPLRVALIQPNIAQRDKWDPVKRRDILDQLKILSMEAAKEQPDVIVWPESALPAAPHRLDADMAFAKGLAARLRVPLVLGYVRAQGQTYYNSAGLISSVGNLEQEYDKLHLVPFGEFVPLRGVFPFLSNIVPVDDMSPGKKPVVFSLGDGPEQVRMSVLICFEDAVDGVARRQVNAGAGMLVNITNDAWFRDTKAPWLHLQAAVFQAVSLKRPLVRSANTGITAVVSPFGEIQQIMTARDGRSAFRTGFLVSDVIPQNKKTVRSMVGDIFAYLCIASLLVDGIIKTIQHQFIVNKRETGGRP